MQPPLFSARTLLCLGLFVSSAFAQTLTGIVAVTGPLAHASVALRDSNGTLRTTEADTHGRFRFNASGLVAPVALSAREPDNGNCTRSDKLRSICVAAILLTIGEGENTANLNPLTDLVTSRVATDMGYLGPQQFVDAATTKLVPPQSYLRALESLHSGFDSALTAAGVPDLSTFDPITTPMDANGDGVAAVLRSINHNRSYDNNSGEAAATVITDMNWRPIVEPFGSSTNEPLQFERSQKELADIRNAKLRVFIVGDSTAATYERQRLPRMGWGQVFQNVFWDGSEIRVVNAGRAGRSSRDFFNGGWYRQMARFIRPGDYVFIGHGHNDQNCNVRRPVRGPADVANLCTYPNDPTGKQQFPIGNEGMSFQRSLETYVNDVRSRGAIPVLLTPTTRFFNEERKQAYKDGDHRPVVSQHRTLQNAAGGFAYVGDYAQTIRETARRNAVPLIDLETRTINFANEHASDWQDYWLVVSDTKKYPWYATQREGTPAAPDTTHFQERGALAIAAMIAQGIREVPALQVLSGQLKK